MRILLVEDDRYTQEMLQTILAGQNFLIDGVADGETAWELLQQFSYDLVLLDVLLPKLDGITLCRRLRQAANSVLIMLLTTRDSLSDKLLGLDSGADDYLTKPFEVPELIARIRTLARRNPTVTSRTASGGSMANHEASVALGTSESVRMEDAEPKSASAAVYSSLPGKCCQSAAGSGSHCNRGNRNNNPSANREDLGRCFKKEGRQTR